MSVYDEVIRELDKFAIELRRLRLKVEHLNEDRKIFEKAYNILMEYIEQKNAGQIDEDLDMKLLKLDL